MAHSKYKAFISYSHKDERWARWLHRSLETYRVPKLVVDKNQLASNRLVPIFRDRDELTSSGDLSKAILDALSESESLIVICSPDAADSRWVNEEIMQFKKMGKRDRVLYLLVGDPDLSFPPAALVDVDGDGFATSEETEPLAADARTQGDGRNDAKLKIIAGLLRIGFDGLRRRESRRRHRRMLSISAGSILGMALAVTLSIFAFISRNEADKQRILAERSRNQAEDLVGFMLGELREKLEPVGRLDVLDSVANKAMDYFLTAGAEEIADEVLVKRSVALRQIGEVRMAQGNLEEGAEAFKESLTLARLLANRNPTDTNMRFELGQIQFWTAYLYWEEQEHELAEDLFTDYLDTANYLLEIDGPDPRWRMEEAYAYLNLGSLASGQELHTKARENFELTISLIEALVAEFPENKGYRSELANAYSWLGGELLEFGELAAAIGAFERHIKVLDTLYTDKRNKILAAQIARGTHHLADLYLSSDDFGNAKKVIARGMKLYSELTELDSENMDWKRNHAMSYLFEARLHRAKDNGSLALEAIEHAREIIGDVADRTDIESYRRKDVALVNNEYARILLDSNRTDAAEIVTQNTIRLLVGIEPTTVVTSRDSEVLAQAYLTMGMIFAHKGDRDHALESWEKAKKIALELRGSSDRLKYAAMLAELLFLTGRTEEANELLMELQELGYRDIRIEPR